MPSLLMGHGSVLTDEMVTLPDGMSIKFLIDEARLMPFSNGVGVVMNIKSLQDEGFSLASEHEGGETIHNHALHVLTNNQRSWYAQVDPEDGSCYYAGEHFTDGLRLCEDPGPDGQCEVGGVHTCGGLLSLTWNDPNLVWVSCRQDASPDVRSKPQTTFGSEANDPANVQQSDYVAFAEDVEKRLKADPAGFAAYFDKLTDTQIAQVMSKLPIRKWSFHRQARAWLQGGATEEQFYAFVQGQDQVDQTLYKDADDLYAAWGRGKFVREATEYLAKAGPENFVIFANDLDQASRTILKDYPDLAAAMKTDAGTTSAESVSARFGMTADQIDWSMVQAVSEKAIKDTADQGTVAFWQLPTGEVLIGENQPETYRKLIELVRDGEANPSGAQPNGTITVVKGTRTSTGELRVTGATDRATMRSWIGAFSDKTVRFQ